MPDFPALRAPTLSRGFDGRAELRKPHQFDGMAIMIDYTVRLKDKCGRAFKLVGLVPEGTLRPDAIKMVVEQNGGLCPVEFGSKGEVDLSKLRWIPYIVLADGTIIDKPHFFGGENGEKIERSKVRDFEFWDPGDADKVSPTSNHVSIEDGTYLTAELPSIKGGGCSGSITQQDIDKLVEMIALLSEGKVKIESYLYDRLTGEITKKEDAKTPASEFIHAPSDFRGFDFVPVVPSYPNLAQVESLLQIQPIAFQSNLVIASADIAYAIEKAGDIAQKSACNSITMTTTNTQNKPKLCEVEISPVVDHQTRMAFVEQKIVLKESMLMRLLMNPTERKLWGRLFGLPDLDVEIPNRTDYQVNAYLNIPKHETLNSQNTNFSYPQIRISTPNKKDEEFNDGSPPKSSGLPKIKIKCAPAKQTIESTFTKQTDRLRKFKTKKSNEPHSEEQKTRTELFNKEKPNEQVKQKQKMLKTRGSVSEAKSNQKHAHKKIQKNAELKPKVGSSADRRRVKNKLASLSTAANAKVRATVRKPVKIELMEKQKTITSKPAKKRRTTSFVVQMQTYNSRSYNEKARTRKTSSFEKGYLLSWLMERPKNRKKQAKR